MLVLFVFASSNLLAKTLNFIEVKYLNGEWERYLVIKSSKKSPSEEVVKILRVGKDPQFPKYTTARVSKVIKTYRERWANLDSLIGETPTGIPFEVDNLSPERHTQEAKPEGTILTIYCGDNILESPPNAVFNGVQRVCTSRAETR